MEAARRQKHPLDARNGMKESVYRKKFLIKIAQQPQNLHNRSYQIWATTLVMIFQATKVVFLVYNNKVVTH